MKIERRTALGLLASGLCPARADALEEQVIGRAQQGPGTASLYAKNLETRRRIELRSHERVRTASTIKLPILAAVFAEVEAGNACWDEPLPVTAREKVGGSGVLASEFSDGVQLPLRDLAHLMIVLSDNTATNIILERFGPDRLNQHLENFGLTTTRILRKIRGNSEAFQSPHAFSKQGLLPANQRFGIGVSTPEEMGRLLEKLAYGQVVSRQASAEMLGILKRCQDDTGIRRRLQGLTVANKTGALDHLRSDVALVEGPAGRIVMAITVDDIPQVDWSPDNTGSLLIAQLAETLARHLA